MSRKSPLRRLFAFVVYGAALGAVGGYIWLRKSLEPANDKPEAYVRFEESTGMRTALARLEREGWIRSELAYRIHALYQKRPPSVASGTYRLKGGLEMEEVYRALAKPIRQLVRLPETNWARRTANLLEKAEVAPAVEYMALWESPQEFQEGFAFPLPKDSTLEGYLFPDTYDLPPLLGARGVVERQLANFERRVGPIVKDKSKLYRTLIIASMVELEVALDKERPIVAGVIENRLKRGMRLQIDATINYGLQKWRPLTYADLRADGPYNTYTRAGLPPTPICSPSLASLKAALNPAKHEFLYYVAMPGKYHLFSKTYDEHLKKIARRKAALKALQRP